MKRPNKSKQRWLDACSSQRKARVGALAGWCFFHGGSWSFLLVGAVRGCMGLHGAAVGSDLQEHAANPVASLPRAVGHVEFVERFFCDARLGRIRTDGGVLYETKPSISKEAAPAKSKKPVPSPTS